MGVEPVGQIIVDDERKTVSILYTAKFETRPIKEQADVLRGVIAVAQNDLAYSRNEANHEAKKGQ